MKSNIRDIVSIALSASRDPFLEQVFEGAKKVEAVSIALSASRDPFRLTWNKTLNTLTISFHRAQRES